MVKILHFRKQDGLMAHRQRAPNLYLQEHYKYRTVHNELQNLNWIKNLKQINTEELMDEFILLFSIMAEVTLAFASFKALTI
jgi:hypothetical protein